MIAARALTMRSAAPTLGDAASGAITIALPLREPAPAMWTRFFAYARPRRPHYSPSLVRVDGACLSVTCPAKDVEAWLVCLDLWIEEANERYAAYEAARGAP